MGNKASILKLDESLNKNFEIFNEVPESIQAVPPRKALPYFLWSQKKLITNKFKIVMILL